MSSSETLIKFSKGEFSRKLESLSLTITEKQVFQREYYVTVPSLRAQLVSQSNLSACVFPLLRTGRPKTETRAKVAIWPSNMGSKSPTVSRKVIHQKKKGQDKLK